MQNPTAGETHRPEHAIAIGESPIEGIDTAFVDTVDEDHGRAVGSVASQAATPRPRNQTLRNTSEPFVPPNPNELDTATSSRISRAVLGT